MVMAVALVLLVVGTILFHFLSPWWFTPIASNWKMMDDTVNITFVVTGIVFVAVNLFMACAVFLYRHRQGRRAEYAPENKKLEWWLTILTSIGVAAMLTPGLFVWAKFVTVPKGATVVEVVGQQWTWSYRFPGRDGVLGSTDARLITPDNPFGIDPNDPRGADDILISGPELHLPINKPVKMLLRSKDVNHQWAVAQFRVKMDMVPGMVTYFWVTPTRTGHFDVLCEQLCGLAHFAMRGRVVVDEENAFQAWLSDQPTYSETRAQVAGNAVAGQALYVVCSACHGPQAQGNQTLNAPKLSSQAGWYLATQLRHFKQGIRGASDQDIYAKQMIPMAATLTDDTAINNVVAYIDSLPDERPRPTLSGDPDRGKSLYTTCAACHGTAGQGIWSTKAPRLAHMSDWYLARQLHNFQQGISGTHPQDFAGAQMMLMPKVLPDEREYNDRHAHRAYPRHLCQLPNPAHVRRPGHGLSLQEHDQLLGISGRRAGAGGRFFRAWRTHRCGLDPVPPAGCSYRYSGSELGHHFDAAVARHIHRRIHHGRIELCDNCPAGPLSRDDLAAHAVIGVGHFHGHRSRAAGLSRLTGQRRHDDARQRPGHQLLPARGRLDGTTPHTQRG